MNLKKTQLLKQKDVTDLKKDGELDFFDPLYTIFYHGLKC